MHAYFNLKRQKVYKYITIFVFESEEYLFEFDDYTRLFIF